MNTTTTVRLTDDERVLLAELARECGTQSAAIGEGIRLLARRSDRRKALREFLDEWAQDIGHRTAGPRGSGRDAPSLLRSMILIAE